MGLEKHSPAVAPLQNRSLFSGISLLPGGSAWVFAPGQPGRKEVYFSRRVWEVQEPLSGTEFREQLNATFPHVLQKYLGGQNQIGMSLTGGLDGRMIMAWANRPAESLPCYTFGGIYRDCTDVRVARRVARACQQPHQVIPVNGAFLRDFPALAEKAVYASDGAMDVTGAVELYVNKIAKGIAPVRLTGNYGSEMVRRNVAFKPGPPEKGLFEPDLDVRSRTPRRSMRLRRAAIRFRLSRSDKCHGIIIRACRLNYRS